MSDTTTSADGPEAMSWTIGRVLTWSAGFLRDCSESPRLDAELLLAHALGLTRIQLYTAFDKPLTPCEREPLRAFLKRRSAGEPVAYITGTKEFMGYAYGVTPAVLIPRPDTEVLVETVLAAAKARGGAASILDVGTGSGCIAVTLALELAGARVEAWDVEPAALAVARANAVRLGADVVFKEVDALAEGAWREAPGDPVFDLLVSNPPYISPAEAPSLAGSVMRYEPGSALFAPPDGLAFYQALARLAPRRLAPRGRLAVEIGSTQAQAVTGILRQCGWTDIAVTKDYGRNDRVVTAERPA